MLKQMVADLNFPVSIRVVPTVREKDGLAMSSRNVYLSPKSVPKPLFYTRPLRGCRACSSRGASASKITGMIRKIITQHSNGKIQYVECVDADTLEPLKILKGKVLIALSVIFGKTRLIDNVIVSIKNPKKI